MGIFKQGSCLKMPIQHPNTVNTRDYKQFGPDTLYHIYNRGTAKGEIFLDKEDHALFISRLHECLYPEEVDIAAMRKQRLFVRSLLPSGAFDLICYCLMPNHFHLLIHQKTDLSPSKLLSKLCTSYSKVFNKKYDRIGALFQDQYKAVPITSNAQLLWISAYIHNNPLKAGLTQKLETYSYSSYPDFVGLRNGTLCKKNIIMDICDNSPASYNKHIMNFDEGTNISLMLDSD